MAEILAIPLLVMQSGDSTHCNVMIILQLLRFQRSSLHCRASTTITQRSFLHCDASGQESTLCGKFVPSAVSHSNSQDTVKLGPYLVMLEQPANIV